MHPMRRLSMHSGEPNISILGLGGWQEGLFFTGEVMLFCLAGLHEPQLACQEDTFLIWS